MIKLIKDNLYFDTIKGNYIDSEELSKIHPDSFYSLDYNYDQYEIWNLKHIGEDDNGNNYFYDYRTKMNYIYPHEDFAYWPLTHTVSPHHPTTDDEFDWED